MKPIECTAAEAAQGGRFGHLLDGKSRILRRVGGKAIYHLAFPVEPRGRPDLHKVRLVRLAPGIMPPKTNHRVEFYADATDRVVITEAETVPPRPAAFYLG